MDEEERKSKVLAGKEALLAFQKKKKKGGKHKKKHTSLIISDGGGPPSEADTSSYSEPGSISLSAPMMTESAGSGGGGSHSGNVSPIPFDVSLGGDDGTRNEDQVVADSSMTPTVSSHPMTTAPLSTSLSAPPTQSNNPAPSPNTITMETTSRYRAEQGDMPDGTADRHTSPVEPQSASNAVNTEAILKLEQQLKSSLDAQEYLQNELNSAHSLQQQLQNELEMLRENYTSSLEQVKREVSSSYQIQLANLQQSLMQTEGQLHDLEHQLTEVKDKHIFEMENVLQTQESIRETMMRERDQKHAEHIARLTTELTNQSEISGVDSNNGGGDRDSDDWEAERLKLIKEKMKELHEKEKEQLLSEHEQEKKQILSEYETEKATLLVESQKAMESNRLQVEQLANSKIQELHAQFMAAHQAVVEQKNIAENNAAQMLNQIQQVQGQLDALKKAKETVEYHYQSLKESHIAELESARRDSLSLEQRLNNWKEKASNLENRLESTKSETSVEIDEVRQQHKVDVERVKSDYEQKIQSLQQMVDEYQSKLQDSETDRRRAVEELRSQHEFQIDELRSSHASEVSLLEENVSESSGDKASLEVAEEHMQSLQKQLDDYRMQERNFESRLSELRRQHAEDLQQVRQTLEAQQVEEVERVSADFKTQIESLEEELGQLSASVESGQSGEVIEALKTKHQTELLDLQHKLRTNHEEVVKTLREEFESANAQEVESLQQQHMAALDDLRKELEKEWSSKVNHEKSLLASELDEARHVEIERLKTEHKQTLDKQRSVLEKSERTAFTKAQEQVKDIEVEMETLRDELAQNETMKKDLLSQLEFSQRQLHDLQENLTRSNTEVSQLSGDCTTYQNRMKSLEVELSIAGSTHEQDVQTLGAMKQEVETYKLKVGDLESELTGLQDVQSSLSEQSQEASHLKDQLAQKNVAIAELQAQNDSLNTEVFSLTQKCQKHIASSEVLQKQLESSWGANEEIESLKQHVDELKPFKERCELLQERVNSLEASFRVKEDEIKELKSQTTAQVHEANECAKRQEEAAVSSNKMVEELTKEVASMNDKQTELKQVIQSLNESVVDIETKLGSKTAEVTQIAQEKEQLQQELSRLTQAQGATDEETTKKYDDLLRDFQTVCAEKDRLAQDIDELRNEQESLFDEQRKTLEEKIQEQEKLIHDMEANMSVKEPETESEFVPRLTEAESQEKSFDSKATQDQLGVVLKEKSGLEENLSRARRALTDKLHDKTVLEKELSFHRTELERRLSEKQRLEELLYEKSRFEQELVNQKDQLVKELTEIESKLQLKDVEHEHERDEWLKKIHQKDDEMTQVTSDLNHRHNMHVSSIVEDHKRKVTGVEQSLRKSHEQDLQSLTTRHRKELEDLKIELVASHEQKLSDICRELDERRVKELATVKEVLQREKLSDMAELEARGKQEEEAKLQQLEQRLAQQYKERLEQELIAEREKLKQTHQFHVQALTNGVTEDNHQQLQFELDHLKKSHREEMDNLKAEHEVALQSTRNELDQQLRDARTKFDEELASKLVQREKEIVERYEARIGQSNEEWEQKMDETREASRKEIVSNYENVIEKLKFDHSEELDNALKECKQTFEDQITTLSEKVQASTTLLAELEASLCEQYTNQLQAAETRHEEEKNRLQEQVKELESICEFARNQESMYEEQVTSFREQISTLESEKESVENQFRSDMEVLKFENVSTLESLEKRYQSEVRELKALHDTNESLLRSKFEADISVLRSQCESLEEKLAEGSTLEVADLRHNYEKQILAKEASFQEELAALRTDCEQKLHESEQAHQHHLDQLNEEHLKNENDLVLAHEKKYQALVKTHEREKQELITKHECQISDLELTQSKRLLELRAEVLHASDAATENFTQQLEKELKAQQEKLESQYRVSLRLQETKLRNELKLDMKKTRSDSEKAHNEALAHVHVDTALKNAQKLEELQQQLTDEHKEILLQELQALELRHVEEIDTLKQRHEAELDAELQRVSIEHQTALEAQANEITMDYEAKLVELENQMASERKTQLTLLKEKYDLELLEREQSLRLQLEEEHMKQMRDLVNSNRAEDTAAKPHNKSQEDVLQLQAELVAVKETHLTRVQELESRHATDIEALQEQHHREIEELKEKESGLIDARLEEARQHLVEEHLAKFKEMTNKLQQVQQGEIDALKHKMEVSNSQHAQELYLLREELETRHEEEISEKVEKQKQELSELHDLYEARLNQAEVDHAHRIRQLIQQFESSQQDEHKNMEDIVRHELTRVNKDLESKLVSLEVTHRDHTHHEADLAQQLVAVKTQLSESERARTVMEERVQEAERQHEKKVKQVEESLAQRLSELEGELDQTRNGAQSMVHKMESLKTENTSFSVTIKEQVERNNQLSLENHQLQETVKQLEGEMKDLARNTEREHHEEGVTLTRMHQEINQLRNERDVLRSSVAALQAVVSSSLQLSTIVDTVLPSPGPQHQQQQQQQQQHQQQHRPASTQDRQEEASAVLVKDELPAQLLLASAGVGTSHEDATPTQSTVSSRTTSTIGGTGGGEDTPTLTDWMALKQTPSFDSGLASHITSILPSEGTTIVETPSGSSSSPVSHATPPPDLVAHHEPVADLTVVPLDASQHEIPSQSPQPPSPAHFQVGVVSEATSMLSVSFMSETHHHEELERELSQQDQTLQSFTEPLQDLSIEPLDSTMSQVDYQSLSDLPALQARASTFHDAVCNLVQSYVFASKQISEYQHLLSTCQSQVTDLQSQLSHSQQTSLHLEQLLKERERNEALMNDELFNKTEQLEAAEEKIQTLVQQVESGATGSVGKSEDIESELIEETQALVEQFKVKENVEAELRREIAHGQSLLGKKSEEIKMLKTEREALREQINDLSGSCEKLRQDLQRSEEASVLSQQESEALKKLNSDLRSRHEQQDIKFSAQRDEINNLRSSFEEKLRAKQQEIHELEDMRIRLEAKEEVEEKLVSDKEEMASRLSVLEHQLATLQAAEPSEEERVRVEELMERERQLVSKLQEQSNVCQSLRVRLQETQSALSETNQELNTVKTSLSRVQTEAHNLRDEHSRKEASLQTSLAEKAVQEQSLHETREQVKMLSQQLEEAAVQRVESEREVGVVKSQVEDKEAEIGRLTKEVSEVRSELSQVHLAHSTSLRELQAVMEGKSGELERVVTEKTLLENQVNSLKDELKETNEDHGLKIAGLEQELSSVRHQLTEKVAQVELLKSEHETKAKADLENLRSQLQQKTRECTDLSQRLSAETRLKASHAGEVSLVQSELARERESRARELTNITTSHLEELQRMNTQHAQKLSDVELTHLEALQKQRGELEAQHAGEMTYIKLHHQEQVEEMQRKHSQEVERIVSEHRQLMTALGGGGGVGELLASGTVGGENLASESILVKIAELAPLLAREANDVKELCKMTGQASLPEDQPVPQISSPRKDSMRGVVNSLRQLVQEIRVSKDGNELEDWRKELLQAVEKVLEQERTMLSAALSGEGGGGGVGSAHTDGEMDGDTSQQILQEQLSQHATSLLELQSADRDSLLAEIRQLRGMLESMRNEQRQQTQELLSQLKLAQSHAETNLSLLRGQLKTETSRVAQLAQQLTQTKRERDNLELALQDLRSTNDQLEQELSEARVNVDEMEGSVEKATGTITALKEELEAVCSREVSQQTSLTEEQSNSAELRSRLDEMTSQSQQMMSEMSEVRRLLESSHEYREALQQRVEQLELELSHANEVARRYKSALKSKEKELDALVAREQQVASSLREALQAKEAELTRTTDQYLQEHLQSQARKSLQADRDRLSREVQRLHKDLDEWKRLAQAHSAVGSTTNGIGLDTSKVSRLYAQYRQAEVHRKALVFQKNYLQCQVDAFYQTQQAALYMMADMGAPVNLGSSRNPPSKYSRPYARFKVIGCVVIATLRFRYILQRKMHYLRAKITKLTQSQGVTARTKPLPSTQLLQREPSPRLTTSTDIPPATGIQTTLSDPPNYSSLHGPAGQHSPLPSSLHGPTGQPLPLPSSFHGPTGQPLPPFSSHSHTQSHSHHVTKPHRHTHSEKSSTKRDTTSSSRGPARTTRPATVTTLSTTDKRQTKHTTSHTQQDALPHVQAQGGPSIRTRSKTSSSSGQSQKDPMSGLQGGRSKVRPHDNSKVSSTADSLDDPQLMAYIKGLEKLQARLSKTKL